jgi:hypothetical protein
MYVEEVGMESECRMDSSYVPHDPRWHSGQHLSTTEEFVGITQIFDANLKNFDPTLRQDDDRSVPGPFGAKKIVSDGGATRHTFHCRKRFRNYRHCSNMVVRIADGKTVPILGVGDVGPLTNVFHVPSLVYDLISESQLDKEGKYLECHGGVRTMRDSRDGPVFFRAHMNVGGLYIVDPQFIDIDDYEYDL